MSKQRLQFLSGIINESHLSEVEYEDIFDKNKLNNLDAKLKDKYSDISAYDATVNMLPTLQDIQKLEEKHKDELEKMAVDLVMNYYPMLKKNSDLIDIDAKIIHTTTIPSVGNVYTSGKPENEKESDDSKKRRIINAITQGGGVQSFGLHNLEDKLDGIDPKLYDLYSKSNKYISALYALSDRDEMKKYAQHLTAGGNVVVKKENGKWKIIARAVNFAILVHEIVKGLYEILSVFGRGEDDVYNDKIDSYTDSVANEIEDIPYGEILYRELREFVVENYEKEMDENPELFEEILVDLYQLPSKEFVKIIGDFIEYEDFVSLPQETETKLKLIINKVIKDL